MAKKRTAKPTSRLVARRRISLVFALVFALITAGIGYLVLKGSFAYDDSTHSLIDIKVTDVTTGKGIPYATVTLYRATGIGDCETYTTTTSGNSGEEGIAEFACSVQPAGFSLTAADKAGYQPSANTPTRLGAFLTTNVGQISHYEIYLQPKDSDGDSVADLTDKCVSQVGPAANKGCPLPSISSFGASDSSVPYNGTTKVSWATSNATGCTLSGVGAVAASGSYATPALTKAVSYVLNCSPLYGYGAGAVSKSIAIAVGAAPTASPGSGGLIIKPTGSSGTTSTQTQKQATGNGSSPSQSSSDTQPPSAPANLTATSSNTTVSLHWDAATDNIGVVAYVIQRSTDQATWDTLADNVTDTNYQDSGTDFSAHYYYRVFAKDAVGNSSDAAVTDLNTGAFSANVTSDQEATITSSNNTASVVIPAGAASEPLYCEIVGASDSAPALTKSQKAIVGPQQLLCKNTNGDEKTDFSKPVKFTVMLGDQANKASALYFVNNNKWTISDNTKAQKGKYEFEMQSTKPFMVLAASNNNLISIIIGIVVLLLLIGVIGFLVWRRSNSNNDGGGSYDSYIASQYQTQTTGSGPNPLESVPTPSAPVPGTAVGGAQAHSTSRSGLDEGGHTPGHHQLDIEPTPVVRPGANPLHSPLDRLREMEEVSGKSTAAPVAPPAEAPEPSIPSTAEINEVKAPGDPSRDPNDFLANLKAPGEGLDIK